LFRSAVQLFSQRGFQKVTVEEITEAADVGKGTFFNYFKGKEHVLSVIPEIRMGKVRHALEMAEARDGRSIRSVVHGLFLQACEEYVRSPEFARALLSSFLSGSIRDLIAKKMVDVRRMLSRILELGQVRGEIDPKLNAEQLALHLQQSSFGTMLLWSLLGEPALQRAVEASFRHFWRSIAVKH